MNVYYTIILNTALAFIAASIKNPSSPAAEALKGKLIELANALNQLIASRWPNG